MVNKAAEPRAAMPWAQGVGRPASTNRFNWIRLFLKAGELTVVKIVDVDSSRFHDLAPSGARPETVGSPNLGEGSPRFHGAGTARESRRADPFAVTADSV